MFVASLNNPQRIAHERGGPALASALATLPVLLRAPAPYRGRRLEVLTYGEEPVAKSEAREALARAGFEVSGDAMILWPSRAHSAATGASVPDWRQPPVLRTYPRN